MTRGRCENVVTLRMLVSLRRIPRRRHGPLIAGLVRLSGTGTVATTGRCGCSLLSRPTAPAAFIAPPSWSRWQSTVPATHDAESQSTSKLQSSSLAIPCKPRFNEIGVQQLSDAIYDQLFPQGDLCPPSRELIDLARKHLSLHDLLGKNTGTVPPVAFRLPPLAGKTLDEHFHRLGVDVAEPFLTQAKQLARSTLPPKPRSWVCRSGWTKYYPDGRTEPVDAPDANMLVFDTEVMWKETPYAVMACAAAPDAWYAWLSPWLLGETENTHQLVPLGDPTVERVIVGHNIGFDRARILEEYSMRDTRNCFLDTMSLHVAVNGMCSRQRPTWMKHKKNRELRDKIARESSNVELVDLLNNGAFTAEEEELWVERSSINSLRDVAQFHLNVTIDKEIRDAFGELNRQGVRSRLDELLTYCAADVAITHRVYQIVFPNFLHVCPHPVSFAALRHLSSLVLPVDRSWDAYIDNAEATYRRLSDAVQERLVALAEKAVEIKDQPEKYQNDPWMSQLDWSGQEIKMVKGKRKGDPPRPAARQKLPGKPKWYKDLFPKVDAPMKISVRTRIAPLLLRLSWEGYPLFWSDKHGFTFRVPKAEAKKYTDRLMTPCDFTEETVAALKEDRDHVYFKLPHKDGPSARCVNPMAKSYLSYFEKGTLSSEYPYAKEALEMNASCSYWISARDRITSQLVVYEENLPESARSQGDSADTNPGRGFILPQIIPMGTITRRAVENTWLTASNAKKNRVGSELKAMVRAPPGYVFVGADVDSEELWIASVVGDATFRLHGGNAIGFMTLEGTKAAGTDLHSRTASILGITRNDAKVFNYGRIYGAGLKFAGQLLRQFNPSLSEQETLAIATRLYASTKGTKTNRKVLYKRPFWRGGTESFVFNMLEEFAEQERPRTPVLGAGITEALLSRYISKGGYLTSRINWAIQSSGVDYLHLLIVGMDYLIRRFNLDARLAITVHDEIRYLVRDHDKYRAAMALQVANLWTRAMFAQQIGIHDLPQSCAFFSAVDIDTVLRKEVDMDCVTPSNPTPIPPGESIDITTLLDMGDAARLDENIVPNPVYAPKLDHIEYTPRVPVMEALRQAEGADPVAHLRFIRAQICNDEKEFKEILKETRKPPAPLASAPKKTTAYTSTTASMTTKTTPNKSTSSSSTTTSKKPIRPENRCLSQKPSVSSVRRAVRRGSGIGGPGLLRSRSLSTPGSFYTARGSLSNAADDTAISSPVDEQPPDIEDTVYRDARQLPRELKSHCQILLEEKLYSEAIQILSGFLSDGSRDNSAIANPPKYPQQQPPPPPKLKPALVPPPSQLALLATLVIHPSFTSLSPETGDLHTAAHALAYLRGLVSTVGPVNANLGAAFGFTHAGARSTRSGGGFHPDGAGSSEDSDDALTSKFARDQLVFQRAREFWSVLGWAFRCAVEYPHRWRHWRVWLDLVVGALEADFDERLARDRAAGRTGKGKSAVPYPMLKESIVVRYLEDLRRDCRPVLREVMRALFAFLDEENQGSDRALYREVFESETRVSKGKRKREEDDLPMVDLENGQFGDYLDEHDFWSEEEMDDGNSAAAAESAPTPPLSSQRKRGRPGRKPKTAAAAATAASSSVPLPTLPDDVASTIPFRLRIFRLLSNIAFYLPSANILAPIGELYETFTDHVRALPLPAYRAFVVSHNHDNSLPDEVQITFLRILADALLPPTKPSGSRTRGSAAAAAAAAARPDPADVDPDCFEPGSQGVTPLVLQECFLPFAAARVTAEDNARLSLALESMAWFVYPRIEMHYTDGLRCAVEKGIKAREEKIRKRAGGREDVGERMAREVLARSARNLRVLVEVLGLEGR
ncbi:hypothetical protein VTJ49DRAFT_2772 [Mycothermus thermophilus]|uniref:DNA-directed DNA polymerase n=1 Tax=Humicola insolens TaxID=85995 RepID=A0ABR3V9B0_HUMIN